MSRDPMDEYLRNIGAEPDEPVHDTKGYQRKDDPPFTEKPEFMQQPFVPEITDDQIIGLARLLHSNGFITVDDEGGVLERKDDGAVVAAEIFIPRDVIEAQGHAYVPHADDEILYAPGPAMAHMMEQAHGTFVDDIKRGCAAALAEHEEPKEPLWERLATSTITLICMGVICFYLGHGAGYKEGVHDVVAPIATALKVEQ